MVGYEKLRDSLAELGVSIYAGSVDSEDLTREVAADVSFPIAYGLSRETGEKLGAWWDEERGFIQPSEFFIGHDGKVIASTYSSSPIGRMEPEDGLALAKFLLKK